MKTEHYSEFIGIDRTTDQIDAPQVSFLKLDNCLLTERKNALVKRGGSAVWATTGDCYGLLGYSQASASYLVPNVSHVIRHRRNAGVSSLEKLNWSTSTWVALTLGANTSFGVGGIAQASQINDILTICAGRPAYLNDIGTGVVNRLGGPGPSTAPTWTLGAGSLTGAAYGYYTFYNSSTGWESSPSPLTALTSFSSQQVTWSALETTCAKEGVDKKRLYRTQMGTNGAGEALRVAEITLATTSFVDNVADASLGEIGPAIGDHNPPPEGVYICAEYAGHQFIASGNALYFSKPYDGTLPSVEYYSESRKFFFPGKITGLAYTPDFGRLLVFLATGLGIYQISGRSESTFVQDVFKKGEGTNFTTSISSHEEMVVYWGATGPTAITPSGVVTNFASGIEGQLDEFTQQEYNGSVYIWSAWHPVHKVFVFGFSATDSATSQWEDAVTSITVPWEDATNGATVEWE